MKLIKIIFFLILVLINFEEFIFKWIPSIQIYEYSLLFTDFLILLSFIYFTLFFKSSNNIRLFNFYLLLFVLVSIISGIINYSFFIGLSKFWVLIRFLLLFYMIFTIFNKNDYDKFLKVIYFLFLIQLAVGVIQLFNFPFLYEFLQPRSDLSKMSNWVTKNELGLAGTFSFTVYYGIFFVAFSGIIPLLKKTYNTKLFLFIICLLFSYLSYSMISFFGVMILFLSYLYFTNYRYFYPLIFIFSIAALFLFSSNYNPIFDGIQNYIYESLLFSRLGIFKIVPLFFTNGLLQILFGMNLNPETLSLFIYDNLWNEIPHVLYNNASVGIEDVYWIAHLYYYGIFGLFTYLMIYLSFIRLLNRRLNKVFFHIILYSLFYQF